MINRVRIMYEPLRFTWFPRSLAYIDQDLTPNDLGGYGHQPGAEILSFFLSFFRYLSICLSVCLSDITNVGLGE